MRSSLACATLAILLVAGAGRASGQVPAPPPGANARNSIVAGTINGDAKQYNYYASPNPTDRRFSSAVTLYVRETYESVAKQTPGVNFAVYDPADPAFAVEGRAGGSFMVFAASDSDIIDAMVGAKNPRCKVGDDLFVAAMAIFAGRDLHNEKVASVDLVVLPADHPMLRALCHGLAMPDVLGNAAVGDDAPTYFDRISDENSNYAILYLSPGKEGPATLEEANAAHYWQDVSRGLELATPAAMQSLIGDRQMRQSAHDLMATGRAKVTIDVGAPGRPSLFSDASRRAYGNRVVRLQAGWLKFLQTANVRLDGKTRNVMALGQVASPVTRVRLTDINDAKFWDALNEPADYLREIACLAASFAVSKGYATPVDLPFSRRCGVGGR